MFNRKCRRCSCLYNYNKNDDNLYETLCNNKIDNNPCYDYNSNCSCGFDDEENEDVFPMNPMFGQSYVPFQTLNETYMPTSGLKKGTIFPELVSDYCPGQSMAEIQYLMDTNEIKEGCNR